MRCHLPLRHACAVLVLDVAVVLQCTGVAQARDLCVGPQPAGVSCAAADTYGDIPTAVNAASASNLHPDTLHVGSGTYALNSTLTVDRPVAIVGAGQGATTITTPINTSVGCILADIASTLSDVTIDSNATLGDAAIDIQHRQRSVTNHPVNDYSRATA